MNYQEEKGNAEKAFNEYVDKLNLEIGERAKVKRLFETALGYGEIYGFTEGLKERRERGY